MQLPNSAELIATSPRFNYYLSTKLKTIWRENKQKGVIEVVIPKPWMSKTSSGKTYYHRINDSSSGKRKIILINLETYKIPKLRTESRKGKYKMLGVSISLDLSKRLEKLTEDKNKSAVIEDLIWKGMRDDR